MAETTNLKLTLLEGSSIVDYNQINAYVSALDNLGLDYVTEKGTSGNWWYRIWKSGRAECGVDNRQYWDSLALNNNWDWPPLWIPAGRLAPFGKYPINFVARPYANVCFNYCKENASCIVIQSNTAGSTDAPSFVLAGSANVVLNWVQVSIFCTGRVS